MKLFPLFLILLLSATGVAQDRVIITGLLDSPAPGARPRALELYVQGTVDLGDYTVERYANAGTEPTNIALEGSYTDAFVYVVNGTDEFATAFGTAGDFANVIPNGNVTGTGDDKFALVSNGTRIDQVGGMIGERENIYQDSYLYRQDGTGPDGDWAPDNWNIPGNDVLDGEELADYPTLVPFGSYRAGGGNTGPTVDVSVRSDAAEPATDGEFAIALSEASATDLVLTYTLSGSGTEGLDYVDTGGGSLTIAAGGTSTVLLLTTLDDQLIEGSETVEFIFGSLSDSTYSAGPGATLTISDDDLGSATIGIHLVQGSGETSPLAGNVVTVEGIVTGDFVDGLGGFYLQEEDSDVDQDSTTSEGIFVFAPDAEVSVGDRVSVTAEVEERFGQTQLRGGDAGASITVDAGGASLPTPRALQLPRADFLLEYLEGMLVAPEDLVITRRR